MSSRRFAILLLPWVPFAVALYYIVHAPTREESVRFALYRPSAAQFYFDRGATRGDPVDYPHDAKATIPFGVPGDVGLVCPQQDREDPRGLRAYAGGLWYLSAKADRQANGDLALGQPSDLPFCADFDGDGTADSGVFRNGEWFVATRGSGSAVNIRFSLGGAGDRPVALNVSGAGNASDRRNIVYGVYRRGVWHLDTRGSGVADATHALGGLPQDLPLLLPRWSADSGGRGYSLAIFRDGIWYVKPDPDGTQTLSFQFGQAGDLPGFAYR